jgi:hypothetical protein
MNEPRIHFAINFFSCPNLLNEAYTAKLNQQLAAVAKVLSMTN